ncbi:MAG: rbsA3 [Frankiales bacterium]|nr:rbsA3 [Frankiales bacterium]
MGSSDATAAAVRPGEPLLRLAGVSKAFGGVQALSDISFELAAGEIHALAGENGAGKSTFVKLVAGVYPPDAGSVVLNGEEHARLTPKLARQAGIAVVHQEFNLLPELSVGENILLGALPRDRWKTVSAKRTQRTAAELLARLGSTIDPRRLVRELTVAQQQLVEIAKALAVDARIILLDEPSTVLSGDELDVLHAVLRRLRDDGRGLIYISHRLNEVFALADRVTVFKDGRHVSTCDTSELDHDELIRRMVGRPLVELFPQRHPSPGQPVLEVDNVSVPGKLFDVSFSLRQGEIVGLAGLGGSGRTTIARAIVGLERVAAGHISLDGAPAPRSPAACARAGLVMVPEDRKTHGILAEHSVAFNLSLPSLQRLLRHRFLSPRAEKVMADRLIKEFGIRPPTPGTDIRRLSGGNQQKVVLARWLAQSPKVVVLDEPTRGVDVGAKAEIYALVERLRETGVSVLLASSELPEILGTCDRVLVLHEGQLVAEMDRATATEEAIMRAATNSGSATVSAGASDDDARDSACR